ncbi:MAG: FtsX-like permease family protein, partial [Bacteroidota bacterium]
KVLGASVFSMWLLLSRDFVILILISSALASLLAYYFLNSWLQNFSYHTELSWWMFAAASLGALVITLLTVSYQSIKAATLNPIEVLKDE